MLAARGPVRTRTTGKVRRWALSPLPTGRHRLARLPVHQEPSDADWREAAYLSVDPFVAEFTDATVHGPAGIVSTGAGVVAESLWQTDERAGYRRRGDRIALARRRRSRRLRGRVLSPLGGNRGNLYHWSIECLGRLAAADPVALDGCRQLLVPPLTAPFQAAALTLAGLDRRFVLEMVGMGEAARAECVVVPSTTSGHHRPNPRLRPFFARVTAAALARAARWTGGGWPARTYVDGRGTANRPLEDEARLIATLAAHGFMPVQLETLDLATEIALFARAEAIVAPHGAGLTHLAHARPGFRVVELLVDDWACWCFRRLAAIGGLTYDCVIGRALAGGPHLGSRPTLVPLDDACDGGGRFGTGRRIKEVRMRLLLFAVSLLLCCGQVAAAEGPRRIGSVDTTFKLLGRNDRIVVDRYDDPRVDGVSCYVSRAETGGIKGSLGLATDPNRFSIACRATGPVTPRGTLPKSEVVFGAAASPFFKEIRVSRLYDGEKRVLIYLVWSTISLGAGGSAYNSITAVPLQGP